MTDLDPRPSLAIIYNSVPPYRVHVHRRIVKEIPWLKLWTVRDHEEEDRWHAELPAEINPVSFGGGVPCSEQGKLAQMGAEWRNAGRMISWIRSERVAAVVLGGYNDVGRLRIVWWCHRHRIPFFIAADSNIRCDFATGVKLMVKRLLLGRVLAWSAGALPCGTLGAAYFMKYGLPRERIFFYPVEPDYEAVTSVSEDRIKAVRENYGLHPGRRHIIYSGRLIGLKRLDLLVDAFSVVADQRPEWSLVMLGDGPLRESLEERVPIGIRGRIIWIGHVRDQNEVSAIYRACDLLVLTSEYDAWSLVICEAAAAGLAIVSTDVAGAAAELVRENVNGGTFPSGDGQALAKSLLDATAPEKIDLYKPASQRILQDWIERGDPIRGLSAALLMVGLS